VPPGPAGAIGAFMVAGAAFSGIPLLSQGGNVDISAGVLGSSGMILLRMSYDLCLNRTLSESFAHPPGPMFVAMTLALALLSAGALFGHASSDLCLRLWMSYTALRGLVLSSINTGEQVKQLVLPEMFLAFEDANDGSGLVALTWAVPALGKVFLCLCLQACVFYFTSGSSTWACGAFVFALAAVLR